MKQNAEKLFGFSKDDLKLIPPRVHKESASRGLLFMLFLSLIVFVELKNAVGKDYSAGEILLTMRNLKCKAFDDEILIPELTKQQKEITGILKIIVPNWVV